MKKIVFFNHWHNGDIFAGKGWIQDIISQYPQLEYGYAHSSHPDVLRDLGLHHTHIDHLPFLDQFQRLVESDAHVFVNTWIGCWGNDHGVMLPGEQHANWPSLHRMFTETYKLLNEFNGMQLVMDPTITKYIPQSDWTMYNKAAADAFVERHAGKRMHLFCNGPVRSSQSLLTNMQNIIDTLAAKNPSDIFICTTRDRWPSEHGNVVFTDDIFQQECDINEIAYLSTKCTIIAGKNSGPYMFTHVRENILDPAKIFVSLSHRNSDSYPWQCKGIGCHYLHTAKEDDESLTMLFQHAIDNANQTPIGEMVVVA